MSRRGESRLPFGLNAMQLLILSSGAAAALAAAAFPNWRLAEFGRRSPYNSLGRAFFATPPPAASPNDYAPSLDSQRLRADLAGIAVLSTGLAVAFWHDPDDSRAYARQVAGRRIWIAALVALLGPTPPPLHLAVGKALFPPVFSFCAELLAIGGIGNMYVGLPAEIAIVIMALPVYLVYFGLAHVVGSTIAKSYT